MTDNNADTYLLVVEILELSYLQAQLKHLHKTLALSGNILYNASSLKASQSCDHSPQDQGLEILAMSKARR